MPYPAKASDKKLRPLFDICPLSQEYEDVQHKTQQVFLVIGWWLFSIVVAKIHRLNKKKMLIICMYTCIYLYLQRARRAKKKEREREGGWREGGSERGSERERGREGGRERTRSQERESGFRRE